MDNEMLAVASQQTLSLFITEGENFCLDEGRCFSTEKIWFEKDRVQVGNYTCSTVYIIKSYSANKVEIKIKEINIYNS